MTADIAAKSIEHDEVQTEHRLKAESNKKFYDSSTKFRETYVKVDNLNKIKSHYQEELDGLKETLQELTGIHHSCFASLHILLTCRYS